MELAFIGLIRGSGAAGTRPVNELMATGQFTVQQEMARSIKMAVQFRVEEHGLRQSRSQRRLKKNVGI
jgi:hypothetical protein